MKLGHRHHDVPLAGGADRPGRVRDRHRGRRAGVDSLWVMDHFFQIRLSGLPPESPMPEAYADARLPGLVSPRESSSARW